MQGKDSWAIGRICTPPFLKKKGFSRCFNEIMIVYDSKEPFAINSVIQIQYFSVSKMLL